MIRSIGIQFYYFPTPGSPIELLPTVAKAMVDKALLPTVAKAMVGKALLNSSTLIRIFN